MRPKANRKQIQELEWTLALSRQLPLWEMESRWTLKTSENNFRGQNSMTCDIFYIIGKFLELRCLKWVRIAHLDIWNTSYGQKKGWESNCQFDSRPEKVGNWLDLHGYRGHVTYRWKALDKSYNFALDCISIRGLYASYGVPKSQESQLARFRDSHSRLPLGTPGREKPFGCGLRG